MKKTIKRGRDSIIHRKLQTMRKRKKEGKGEKKKGSATTGKSRK